MSQVVQKLIAQSFPLMGARHQSSNIEQLNGDGTLPAMAGPIIWFAPIFQAKSGASALYLKIANGSLRVDRGEAEISKSMR